MGTLILENISLNAHIGVSEKERLKRQTLLVSIEIETGKPAGALRDMIEKTLDYSVLKDRIKAYMHEKEFHLIETVAEELAFMIKKEYGVPRLTVTVKKFPYRDMKHVAYRITV